MKYSITLTGWTKTDIASIFNYIAVELQSRQNAVNQLARLEKAIASLDEMPERYRVYDHENWCGRNLRVMPVDKYLIFYIPDKESRIVTVLRVLYGGRDIDRQIENLE